MAIVAYVASSGHTSNFVLCAASHDASLYFDLQNLHSLEFLTVYFLAYSISILSSQPVQVTSEGSIPAYFIGPHESCYYIDPVENM